MIKVIMNGCNGKMGQVISGLVANDPEVEMVAGIDKFDNKVNSAGYSAANTASISSAVISSVTRPEYCNASYKSSAVTPP